MNLQPSEIAYFGRKYDDIYKRFSGEGQNTAGQQQQTQKKVSTVPPAAIDFLISSGELDQFIDKYKVENLPKTGIPKRPTVNDFEIKGWDSLWGRYYNADGTLK